MSQRASKSQRYLPWYYCSNSQNIILVKSLFKHIHNPLYRTHSKTLTVTCRIGPAVCTDRLTKENSGSDALAGRLTSSRGNLINCWSPLTIGMPVKRLKACTSVTIPAYAALCSQTLRPVLNRITSVGISPARTTLQGLLYVASIRLYLASIGFCAYYRPFKKNCNKRSCSLSRRTSLQHRQRTAMLNRAVAIGHTLFAEYLKTV